MFASQEAKEVYQRRMTPPEMNLYLISQDSNDGYDTYDSAVVVAESEGEARIMHPNPLIIWKEKWQYINMSGNDFTWADPKDVKVELIGVAIPSQCFQHVVCSSFNAG